MKVTFIVLLFIAGAFTKSTVQNEKQIQETGPACPLPDPLLVPAGLLNISLHPVIQILEGGSHGELTVVGLTSLSYEYTINLLLLNVNFHVTLGEIDIQTDFADVNGYIDLRPLRPETVPSGNFSGSGNALISAKKINLKGKATLFVNLIADKVTIRLLNIENLSFDSVSIDLGTELLINDKLIDWPSWSSSFKQNFDKDWKSEKAAVTEKIRLALNTVVGKYSLQELLELISNAGDVGCSV